MKKVSKIWESLVNNHLNLKDAVSKSRKAISEAFLEYYKAEYPDKINELENYYKAEIIGIEHEENHDSNSGEWADILTLKFKYPDDKTDSKSFVLYKSEYYDIGVSDDYQDMTNCDSDDPDEEYAFNTVLEILKHIFQEHPDVEVYYS